MHSGCCEVGLRRDNGLGLFLRAGAARPLSFSERYSSMIPKYILDLCFQFGEGLSLFQSSVKSLEGMETWRKNKAGVNERMACHFNTFLIFWSGDCEAGPSCQTPRDTFPNLVDRLCLKRGSCYGLKVGGDFTFMPMVFGMGCPTRA